MSISLHMVIVLLKVKSKSSPFSAVLWMRILINCLFLELNFHSDYSRKVSVELNKINFRSYPFQLLIILFLFFVFISGSFKLFVRPAFNDPGSIRRRRCLCRMPWPHWWLFLGCIPFLIILCGLSSFVSNLCWKFQITMKLYVESGWKTFSF